MSLFEKIYYAADRDLKDTTILMLQEAQFNRPRLLDLGCGDCRFTERLVDAVNPEQTWAVDSSPDRIEYAIAKGYQPVKADLNQGIPLEDGSMDIIHAGDVIEHLNNTDLFIKEIRRLLSPIGFAVISTPNLASWHNIAALFLGRQPFTAMVSDEMKISEIEADKDMPKHRRIFTFDGLERLVKFHGLRVIESIGCGYYPFTGIVQEMLSVIDYRHAAYVLAKVGR